MSITPLMPVYPRSGVRPVEGDHCHLIDEDGTRYLDFAAGIAVNLLGHSHPGLIGAIQAQAAKLMHVSNLYGSPQGERLAQRLVELTFADTVFFTNSGVEAVECAIKTARAYHQHVGNTEPYFILQGKGIFIDNDGSRTEVGPGDVCCIEVGQSHGMENASDEDLVMMALVYNE